MAVIIALDAGHGGYDNGASYKDRLEKDDTLRLTLAVGKILQNAGYEVVYTRTTDESDSPCAKARIANEAGADYFVSLHRNANPTDNLYNGVQSLVFREEGIAYEMARDINAQLEKVGFKNIDVEERPGLIVLRRTQMPAVLVEVGFIDSDIDNELFDSRFQEIAQAIADGIIEAIPQKDVAKNQPFDQTDVQESAKTPIYAVQVGLFSHQPNAAYLYEQLKDQGFTGKIERSGPYYAVRIGAEESLDAAVALKRRLAALGYDTLVVKG
jgi:N-acetylmuramoyl-L-alanine amidase